MLLMTTQPAAAHTLTEHNKDLSDSTRLAPRPRRASNNNDRPTKRFSRTILMWRE